jgi:hypothetical protein
MDIHPIVACPFLLATLWIANCGHSAEPGGRAKPDGDPRNVAREVDDIDGIMASMGTHVRVRGTAQNDKLSAVIEARGVTVYCLDLEGWPADRVGKPATIEGTLERTDQFAVHASDGLVSQGTSGSIIVLRHCAAAP